MREVFVERLEKLLKDSNISQRDLAQDIGVTESAVSKYLSGDRIPSGDILLNLATAFNTTSDYMLGLYEEDEKADKSFFELKGILARNTKDLTPEQKNKLIQMIVKY